MGSLGGPKARREPAGEAKPDVRAISDGEAGAYCTVGLVYLPICRLQSKSKKMTTTLSIFKRYSKTINQFGRGIRRVKDFLI